MTTTTSSEEDSFEQTTIAYNDDVTLLKNPIIDGLHRALVVLNNPNWPINRFLRQQMHHHQIMQQRFNHVLHRVRKKFVSRSLCIACIYLQVNNNAAVGDSDDDAAAAMGGQNPRLIQANPVVGAIETVGKLATLLVQLGEQVLPGLIANITLDNPSGVDRMGLGHNRAFVRALIRGPEGENNINEAARDVASATLDTVLNEN